MTQAEMRTIHDMLNYFYGVGDVAKTDAPVLTTTTGVYNPVYGAQAFAQLNNEANIFGLLPKLPWRKSGWRVITAHAGSAADGGTTESGAIADSVKPTFAEVSTKPKQVQHVFQVSMIHEGLVQKDDDNIGDMEFLRGYFATKHALAINQQLAVDVDTLAGYGFESIDRVCSSYSEVTAGLCTAGDSDIYGLDRDAAASWADAVVEHNSGTDRALTNFNLILSTLATISANGGKTNLILTGWDTYYRIVEIAQSSVRYQGAFKQDTLVQIGVNGVGTAEGVGFGVEVASLFGKPLFVSQSIAKDTISRIYLLDTTANDDGTPRLFIGLLYPTMYFESGMAAMDRNPWAINYTGTKGMYYTAGELICTFFKAQGKIRDLM